MRLGKGTTISRMINLCSKLLINDAISGKQAAAQHVDKMCLKAANLERHKHNRFTATKKKQVFVMPRTLFTRLSGNRKITHCVI